MNMKTILIPSVVVGALALAGCASSAPDASPSTSATTVPMPESTEHPEAQPRLVITYADGSEVLALDDITVTSLATFDSDAPQRPVAGPDGRHVYLVDGEGGTTLVLDAGSYAQGHDDHFHYFTRTPAMRPDVIEGDTPVHVVGHHGQVAIFNDGDGTVDVFDEIGLTAGGLTIDTLSANMAHHGVAVPVHDGYLVTSSPDGGLPDTVLQTDREGNEVAAYTGVCPGLHGEAAFGELIAFGCATGVVLVDPEAQTTTFIPNPAGAGENRVGSLFAAGDSLVGNWGPNAFSIIDGEGLTITPIDAEGTVAGIARGPEEQVIVLTTDGAIHVFDETGVETAHIEAIAAFELPEGHGVTRPGLAVAGETLAITDVAGERLVLVDLHAGAVAGEFSLSGTPTAIVATGLSPIGADHEDHDH